MANQSNNMMDQAKEWTKEGADAVQNAGEAIGDAARSAVKSVSQGAANLAETITGNNKNK